MIAPSTKKKRRVQIPMGRRMSNRRSIGFHSTMLRRQQKLSSLIRAPDEKHLITIAPTGAGKFRSMLAAELLTYPGPVVCVDIKGEAYAVSARRRREMGQRVVRLDPFEVIGQSYDAMNFFDLFSLPNSDVETDAQMISSIISDVSAISKDPFWDISGRGIVSGLIVYLARHRAKSQQNLKALRELLYSDDTDYNLAVILDKTKPMHPLAHGEIAAYLTQPERETRPSVLATARSYFKPLFSDRIESCFGKSTFPLTSVMNSEPMTIYLVIPPNKLESHRRLIRLWVATLMAAITARRQIPELPTLFLLDEAAQLGHFPPLLQAMTVGRGFGIRAHSFWQDLSQLMTCYPTEWRTIVNNCGVKQVFGMNDSFMATGLDELFHVPLRQLATLPSDEQLLLINGETMRAKKLDYLSDREFQGLYDDNPYHGGTWPVIPAPPAQSQVADEASLKEIAEREKKDADGASEPGIQNG